VLRPSSRTGNNGDAFLPYDSPPDSFFLNCIAISKDDQPFEII